MTSEASSSAVGQLDTLSEGQVLLPSFVLKYENGLYVDLSAMDSRELFCDFVEKVFGNKARFVELDYSMFNNLLYFFSPEDISMRVEGLEKSGQRPHVRLAKDIVHFPLNRLELYRGFKMMNDMADYYFEQISVDTETDGMVLTARAYLDFDEFVTAMWLKGVRHGIDEAAVRAAIAADKVDRITAARPTPPKQGNDATLVELSKALHRDDSPKLLPDGRVDLCHFSNRFPQVTANTALVKKVPIVPGVSGWSVTGKELLPNPLKDFDAEKMVGEGTRLEKTEGGEEIIIAVMDGFLDIDTKTSKFTVSEKIVSRSGVSVRTTGNLALSGDEFEEHGEVQEKRLVSGKHMTFFSDVFGNIESTGGRVVLKKMLSGGSVKSPGGEIIVEGSASRAVLDAGDGAIEVAKAESATFIAKTVKIGQAVCCNIVAETVIIEKSEGSAIAAKQVTIGMSSARKAEDTIVTMLVPDAAGLKAQIAKLEQEKLEAMNAVAEMRKKMSAISDQPEVKSYLAVMAKLKAKTLTMTPPQEKQWQALTQKLAPTMRDYSKLHGELAKIQERISLADAQIKELEQTFAAATAGVRCEIGEVFGETIVRRRLVRTDAPPLASLPPKDLHTKLHEGGAAEDRIFTGDSGAVKWTPPQEV